MVPALPVSAWPDEEGLVFGRCPHDCDILQALGSDALMELLGGIRGQHHLIGGEVNRYPFSGVLLEAEVTRHISIMPPPIVWLSRILSWSRRRLGRPFAGGRLG